MHKEEALDLLRRGQSGVWNQYRKSHPNWKPDLEGADLSQISLSPPGKPAFDLTNANLVGCKLPVLQHLLPSGELQIKRPSKKVGDQTISQLDSADVLRFFEKVKHQGFSKTDFSDLRGNMDNIIYISQEGTKTTSDALLDAFHTRLSGALIDRTTSIEGGEDLELLVALGARFVTQEELKRERAEVTRKLFISYAWAEEEVIDAIEQWLRQKGLVTIMDKRNFIAGEPIKDEIVRGMSDADAILLFHSERTANKPWIEFERKLARKFKSTATQEKRVPPQMIFVVLDNTPLPETEKGKIAIMAKGKKLPQVCQEIYDAVLHLPKTSSDIDLTKWENYEFK